MLTGAIRKHWTLGVLLLIAAVWLCRTPYSAGNLDVQPDTVEYTIAPLELLETGHYAIPIEDRMLPPRYPPWFSVIVLLPSYVLFGHDPGNAILPVTALAVCGVGFAYGIGRRIGGEPSGLLAGLAVLLLPSYSMWATQPMSDVPCGALVLATCLVYLRTRTTPRARLFLFAGVLIAVAALFRPVCAAMLLPLMYSATTKDRARAWIRRLAALLLPLVAALIMSLSYNAARFGSPFRNGYNVWVPVPMDYPWLAFSFRYIPGALQVVASTAFPILLLIAVVSWLLLRRRRTPELAQARPVLRDTVIFVALTSAPIFVFHLLYFYRSDRFHIPMFAGTAVIMGSLLGLLVSRFTRVLRLALPVLLVAAIAGRIAIGETVPHRRLAAERIRKYTPPNAIVISAIDPVYLQYMAARGTERRIVPLSRDVEYASKLLAWRKIADPQPPPRHWRQTRSPGLIRGGAEEAVKFVASEQLETIAAEVARGTPVFLDATFADTEDAPTIGVLRQRFALVPRTRELYQLELRR